MVGLNPLFARLAVGFLFGIKSEWVAYQVRARVSNMMTHLFYDLV